MAYQCYAAVEFELKMVLTTAEKVFLVEHYFRSYGNGRNDGPSLQQVSVRYREQFNKAAPSKSVILGVVEKFRRTGSVLCQRKGSSGRRKTVCTNENAERVLTQVVHSPQRSLVRTACKLNISETSTRRLFTSIGGYPYRIQVGQRLNAGNKHARAIYCGRILSLIYEDPEFLKNIWFSDESHVHLNGYINRQTTRFLGFERPDVIVEKPLHSVRVTIWCAVSGHGIIGPYFVEDDNQNPLTVNQERYREKIIVPFMRDLQNFCRARNLRVRTQWFQQDGATSHTAARTLNLLRQHFDDRIISRGTDFEYPSHSPDLTPPDAYIWGMMKETIFRTENPPENIAELRERIQTFFQHLNQPLFINMFSNLQNRYEACLRRNGEHFEHLKYRD